MSSATTPIGPGGSGRSRSGTVLRWFTRREPAAFAVAGIAAGVALERVVRAMRASTQSAGPRGATVPPDGTAPPAVSPRRSGAPIDLTGTGDEQLVGASSTGYDDELLGAGAESDVHVTSRFNPAP